MRFTPLAAAALVAAVSAPAPRAALGAAFYDEPAFVEPAGWTVGDAGSTYQLWHEFADTDTAPVGPDAGEWTASPAVATTPTFQITSPGFMPGPGRTYSFSTPYGAAATVGNVAPGAAGLGTHVILQVATSLNPDLGGIVAGSVHVLDGDGDAITAGGEAIDALQATAFGARPINSPFGPTTFAENIFEFFLPGYTGDFTLAWTQNVHAGIEAVRVDSYLTAEPLPITAVPEPASLTLLAAGVLLALRRR